MRGKIIERGDKRGVFIRRIIAFNLTCEFVCICFCVRSDEECSNDKIEKLAVLRESSRCGIYFRSMYIQRNAGYGVKTKSTRKSLPSLVFTVTFCA